MMSPDSPASSDAPTVPESEGSARANGRGRLSKGRLLKLVRRVHMYLGLVLMPWLLFFGLSGMLFNHPNVGEQVQGQRVNLTEHSGLAPWQPQSAAQSVVTELNQKSRGDGPYRLDPTFQSEFTGYSILTAPAPDGGYMLIADVAHARGILVHKQARTNPDGSSFPKTVLTTAYSAERVAESAKGLLTARKLPHDVELQAHPKIAAELRLRVLDAKDVAWNLSYDTRTGELSGRRADRFPNLGMTQILAKMHTTHHFTMSFGSLWLWALFEDLLGLSMALWAITGLVMWWQMKATRIAGIVSITLALGLALAVMSGVFNQLTFGDVKAAMGPGE